MKEKIKNFFKFIGTAWAAGIRGKIGLLCGIFATFMFIGIFWGDVSIQKFVINLWRLNEEQQELTLETKKLDTIKHHIKLIENYSPDYIEELGLKYLNIGDKQIKELKIN